MESTTNSSDSREQLAREAAYQLLTQSSSNVGSQTTSIGNENNTVKQDSSEVAGRIGSRNDTSFQAQRHDTVSYLLAASSVIIWLILSNFSNGSTREAYAAAIVDLLRVTAVTVIICILDWCSRSLLAEDQRSESRSSSLARTFALSLIFVMVADGMRVDERLWW